jgi:hypothetical protein
MKIIFITATLASTQVLAQKIDLSRFDDTGGKNPTPIVVVSDACPDPYTHPTTHPRSLEGDVELSRNVPHGDGIVKVAVMGKTVEITRDGEMRPVTGVRFFQLNDNMLLNQKRRIELPLNSDKDGNVAGPVYVFAASLPLASDTIGEVFIRWELKGCTLMLNLEVPAGSRAAISLPQGWGGVPATVGSGTHRIIASRQAVGV